MKKVYEYLCTKINTSTDYHPQTDNRTKELFKMMENMLGLVLWILETIGDEHLPSVEFCHNDDAYARVSKTPYEMLYERRTILPSSDH